MENKYIYLPQYTVLKDKYKIITNLSERSHFSIVYLAENDEEGKKVVIKEFYPPKLALRDLDQTTILPCQNHLEEKYTKEREKFLQEGKILQNIECENICECYEYFQENNTGYIVMKYYSGKTLEEYLNQGIMSFSRFFETIYFPLLKTVHKLHKKGYIHRDIKPQNVIMQDSEPILLDFGSAINYEDKEYKNIAITPGFSPIELHSSSSNQGIYSDIYSLSSILYYFFTNKIPTPAKHRIIKDNIPGAKELNSELSDYLNKVIMKNLSMNYRERDKSLFIYRMKLYLEYCRKKIKEKVL